MDFLRSYQLDIMLVLTGILVLLLLFSITIRNLSVRNRFTFIMIIGSATLLLLADRYAYIFRGDESTLGLWMVRISNFVSFLMAVSIVFFYNALLKEMIRGMLKKEKVPKLLYVVDVFCGIHTILIVVTQFTGLLYFFDEANRYQRSSLSFIGYIMPLASMVLQLIVILRYHKSFGRMIRIALYMFDIVPFVASIIQLFIYGLSLIDISTAIMVILLNAIALNDMNIRAEKSDSIEMDHLLEQQKRTKRLLDQTATALIAALDAKEEYTQGHSGRVAKYARQIAEYIGKDEKECDEIYYAGLLHDIGKIGIPDEIINKTEKLTPEEYEIMKQHPSLGRQILSGITEMPYLAVGAGFHHERYDGTGYPEGLAGDAIPELARILAVADAYDVMSSNRSFREPIPQQKIREEFIKYSGTQFDPRFAQVMQHLIDLDSEFQMQEKTESVRLADDTTMMFGTYRDAISEGLLVTANTTTIRLTCEPHKDGKMPSLVLFDSLDAAVHVEEPMHTERNYFEYGEIWFDGKTEVSGEREMQTEHQKSIAAGLRPDDTVSDEQSGAAATDKNAYEIMTVRYRDHAMFTIGNQGQSVRVIVALPDNTRFLYAGIIGEDCRIKDIQIERSEDEIGEGYIPRIAEEISFIGGPVGDVPNIQIDGYRTEATVGIPIRDGMELRFHTMSLPTARLVWHTAFIDIFYSDDRLVNGPNYTEFALIRLDGEYWDDSHGMAENKIEVVKRDPFTDWEDWKALNKKGMDCAVRFLRRGNTVTTITENDGIAIRNITTVASDVEEMYVSLSGDQVALTDIRIHKRKGENRGIL